MDRAPFSAFLLLLIGVVLLAQFMNNSLDAFIAGLLGTTAAATPPSSSTTGSKTSATASTYAGNARVT